MKQNWKSEIRGFGKDAEEATVYAIPEFSLSDGKERYKIQNLLIAVCNHPLIGYDLILSDTMFSKADTYIHRIGNKFVEIVFEKEIIVYGLSQSLQYRPAFDHFNIGSLGVDI